MSTSHKILNLLNRKEMTVSELANVLGISRNSTHLQMSKLESAGIVEKFYPEQSSGAGKPAYFYRTTAGNEDAFSSAYKPVLNSLIQTISADLPEKERIALLENAGRSLARASGLQPSHNLTADIQQSIDTVNTLGAMAEVSFNNDQPSISCHSCPVATLVHADPLVCRLVAAFFSEATNKQVSIKCRHQDTVICGFSFQ